jgi:hypothetical protein
MEIAQLTLNFISDILKYFCSWPVAIFFTMFIFRKAITEKIKSLRNFEGYGMKAGFRKETKILDKKITETEKAIAQPTFRDSDFIDTDNPKIAIPLIYSKIEAAAKEKFDVDYSYNMPLFLYEKKKINTDMFIILDSMRALRDNIYINAYSREINEEDIAHYRHNANRIIKIIENMDVDENT